MENARYRFGLLTVAAAAVLIAGAGISQAQTLPCSAFARTANGAWKVLDPVMLNLNGRLYSPTVGTVFPARATPYGIEIGDMLDRKCGNQ